MSIIVENITKYYGEQVAVNDISFEANKGSILGFLGPNGAGKSTTMKILTGFIPPSSGKGTICGFDIVSQSIDVRKNIGYLPEHNPLYLDMYVKESLSFTAGIHKLSNIKKHIDRVIELTGLSQEQHKKIGQLSKGYRQRVGLAQAIIHDPKVLILDEPTTGLDPNQLIEIRKLIKNIGQEKTVLFSTHIMQEVEAICDKVLIITKGKIVANDSTDNIKNIIKSNKFFIFEFDKSIEKSLLLEVEGVLSAEHININTWKISANKDIRAHIFDFANKNKLTLLSSKLEENSLEDIFRALTK